MRLFLSRRESLAFSGPAWLPSQAASPTPALECRPPPREAGEGACHFCARRTVDGGRASDKREWGAYQLLCYWGLGDFDRIMAEGGREMSRSLGRNGWIVGVLALSCAPSPVKKTPPAPAFAALEACSRSGFLSDRVVLKPMQLGPDEVRVDVYPEKTNLWAFGSPMLRVWTDVAGKVSRTQPPLPANGGDRNELLALSLAAREARLSGWLGKECEVHFSRSSGSQYTLFVKNLTGEAGGHSLVMIDAATGKTRFVGGR